MREIADIRRILSPVEVLFVADAMTGQEAVNVSKEFHERIGLTGVVLTKMDGDARGGAALSINAVTGAPVKFVGVGEKTDQLELFHPERIAGRILGMGDILSLVEKAQEKVDTDKAVKLQKQMLSDRFNLEDFLAQMKMMKQMGPMESLLGMLPGVGGALKQVKGKVDLDRELRRIEAIVQSMTRAERLNPEVLDASRRRRIAAGSGTRVQDINQFMKQYLEMKKMMKRLKTMGLGSLMKGLKGIG
ncbi:MAG TPA: signal recognition particle protein, partial [bacterium]|nr:signal recognition particle protein [bacterium]